MGNLSEYKQHKMYLDWCNNFISIKGFADHYNIRTSLAYKVIESGRKIHNEKVKVLKFGNTKAV